MKLRTNTGGFITGIRYYKPATATGTHVGTLWTGTGTKLATATFTNETASGWQQATFPDPVAVTANTTYVASYYAPSRYAVNTNYFTTATTRGPLTALANGTDGGNGVYRYGATAGTFPNQTYNNENYWVDVVFNDVDNTKPTVTAAPPHRARPTSPWAWTSQPPSASRCSRPASTSSSADPVARWCPPPRRTTPPPAPATLDPNAALSPTTTYTANLTGARDPSGNLMDPVTWTFTTGARHHQAHRHRTHTRTRRDRRGRRRQRDRHLQRGRAAGHDRLRAAQPGGTLVPADDDVQRGEPDGHSDPNSALSASTAYTASLSRCPRPRGQPDGPGHLELHHDRQHQRLPVHDLADHGDARPHRRRHQLGRARREVPHQHRRLHHRHPLLQAERHHRHPRRQPVDRIRHQARRPSPSPASPPSAGSRPPSPRRSRSRANTTYVASYFTPSRYVVSSNYFATRHHPRAAHRPGQRHRGRQRPLPLRRHRRRRSPPAPSTARTTGSTSSSPRPPPTTLAPTVTSRVPAPGSTGVRDQHQADRPPSASR